MKNSREDMSLLNNFRIPLEQYENIAQKTNTNLNSIDTIVSNTAFTLGIESVLAEIAILKMTELEDKRGAIESNATYNKAWNTLWDINEGLYDQLGCNQASVADRNFILGFVEGYRMMKLIVENSR